MAAAADKRLQQEKSQGMKDLEGYKRKQACDSLNPGKKMKTTRENITKHVEEKSQEGPDLAMEMKNLVNLVCRILKTHLLIFTDFFSNCTKLLCILRSIRRISISK